MMSALSCASRLQPECQKGVYCERKEIGIKGPLGLGSGHCGPGQNSPGQFVPDSTVPVKIVPGKWVASGNPDNMVPSQLEVGKAFWCKLSLLISSLTLVGNW